VSQDAAKYATRNPVVRWLLWRWLRHLRIAVAGDSDGARTGRAFLDVGAGEGLALARMRPPAATPVVAVDLHPDKLRAAGARVPDAKLVCADAARLPFTDAAFATVTCTEVLEHVPDASRAAAELGRVCADRCVVSVPWEPYFRLGNLARAKNVRRFGNDVEHIRHYSRRRLTDELGRWFALVTVRGCFPWLVAVTRAGPPA
jgi:ubiquinone/menaquinone biosynthesis C-methylase UbiE